MKETIVTKVKKYAVELTAVPIIIGSSYYISNWGIEPPLPNKEGVIVVSVEAPAENPINNNKIVSSGNAYEECMANKLPSFINISLGWYGSAFGFAFYALSPPSVIVTSAGNSHPDPLSPEKVRISRNINAIIVGSMTWDGRRSHFSQTHEEVHIMAPADYDQSSADEEGNRMRFGGTSGAAPLVTGSLAGFEWLSGYHPTAEEAKLLLEKTAIPTINANKVPQLSGVGMVNAYKLGMVGERLKITCGRNVACFKEMIQNEATYNFPEDQGLLQAVNNAFPHCSSNQCKAESSRTCEDKDAVFERLRKAAFLNPSNGELWRNIACIYDSGNFTKNAQGAMSTYKATFGNMDNSLYTACEVDADCTHVPFCYRPTTNLRVLLPVNKDYVAECQGRVLCNNKCRCGPQEFYLVPGKGIINKRTATCVNSQCVSEYATHATRAGSSAEPADPRRQPATSDRWMEQNNNNNPGSGSIQ